MDPLTPRQREILLLATDGATTADIAAKLGISAGTVRNYLSEVILMLGAANRIEAAVRYSDEAIQKFKEAGKRQSTSQPVQACA